MYRGLMGYRAEEYYLKYYLKLAGAAAVGAWHLLELVEWMGRNSQKGRPSRKRGSSWAGKQWANTAELSLQSTWGVSW